MPGAEALMAVSFEEPVEFCSRTPEDRRRSERKKIPLTS